ncbi:MAG: hypothetical protein FWH56_01965 [Betaproteobacteria bacterium]|nr:hypothetical protein [Betaproteobacteria bacterium]
MMALYRTNPTAFINNNINRLKTGVILKMPSGDEARSSSHGDARREVSVHTREFNAWRAQLAAEVADRPATPMEDSAGSSRSIDTIPPPAELDRDKVVIATNDGSGDDVASRLQDTETDLVSTQAALKEASERIKELEDIAKLEEQRAEIAKRAAELRDQALRGQQSTPAPSEQTQTPVAETASAPTEPPADPVVEETPPTPEPAPVEPVVTEPESPQQAEPSSSPLSVDASQEFDGEDPMWEMIRTLLGVGALLVMILGAYFGIRSWRQNKRSDIGLDTLSQEATSMFPSEATSIFGDNGGQSVDTTGSSVIHTDFSQTGLSIDTNEGVDPVAEADVYMAYGRDSQAEEILNDALKADPKRGAIYVKLLEIYAQRQDLMLFETTASELFSRTEGQGRDWEKAAQMGRRLDPSNPLYSGKSPEQKDGDFSRLPGLEPALEEPSRLDMGAPQSVAPPVSSGPALSDLDFGASPGPSAFAATNTGQLKDTVAAQGRVEDILSEQQVTAEAASGAQRQDKPPKKATEPTTEVDFQFEPAEDGAPKSPGSIDFDLGKSKQASETGKQPISVTVSRPSSNAKGTASRQPIGVSSKKADSRTASPKAAKDLAGPLDFDMPAQDPNAYRDMSATVVLPSALGGDEHSDDVTMDLENTGFDPNALDFDLDLNLKPDTAAVPASPRTRGRQSSVPVGGPLNAEDAEEFNIKLDLAKAYGEMGDTEGALELLREVVDNGNATQKAEARALITTLG